MLTRKVTMGTVGPGAVVVDPVSVAGIRKGDRITGYLRDGALGIFRVVRTNGDSVKIRLTDRGLSAPLVVTP